MRDAASARPCASLKRPPRGFGEFVALSVLRHKARTYNEPFTIHLTKFDGSTATISNEGNP